MPTLTEVLPASKTSAHRAMRYSPVCVGAGVVVLEDKRASTRYAVQTLPYGGVRFTKPGGGENYVATATSCECKGFVFGRSGTPCKHVECVRAMVANDWLSHDGREAVSDRAAEIEEKDSYYRGL